MATALLIAPKLLYNRIMDTFSDTTTDADAMIIRLLRETPVWRKLELMEQLTNTACALALSGLRQRYPQANEVQLRRLLADQILGKELAVKAYGPAPTFEAPDNAP